MTRARRNTAVRVADIAPVFATGVITAPTWSEVIEKLRARAVSANGTEMLPGITMPVPRLRNRDAAVLVQSWGEIPWSVEYDEAPPTRFGWHSLWPQYQALAYGWDPSDNTLDISPAHGDEWYPDDIAADLWGALRLMAEDADARGIRPLAVDPARPTHFSTTLTAEPLVEMASVAVTDNIAHGSLPGMLRDDMAVAWKIPLPACKGPDGKPGKPRRDKNGKWKCDPVTIDDPVTIIKNEAMSVVTFALMVGALWLLSSPRRGR